MKVLSLRRRRKWRRWWKWWWRGRKGNLASGTSCRREIPCRMLSNRCLIVLHMCRRPSWMQHIIIPPLLPDLLHAISWIFYILKWRKRKAWSRRVKLQSQKSAFFTELWVDVHVPEIIPGLTHLTQLYTIVIKKINKWCSILGWEVQLKIFGPCDKKAKNI